MSAENETPDKVSVTVGEEHEPEVYIEEKLQQVYGSGIYLSDFYEAGTGTISMELGNSFPKDVSDCRPGSKRVIKYIAVDGIADLSAKQEGSKYIIELESRGDVNKGFIEAKDHLREDLDHAMAKASFEKIAVTPAVENQLNPIKQILRWTRRNHPVDFEEVRKAQDKDGDKTLQYVRTLEELGFIEHKDGKLFAQKALDKYDLDSVQGEEFNEKILGEVIDQGFKRLSQDLGLNILRHLPKFANGYYLDAVERNEPELYLDLEAIRNNIHDWYGYSSNLHDFVLQDKLDQLTSLEILEKENKDGEDYYTANRDTYDRVERFAGV